MKKLLVVLMLLVLVPLGVADSRFGIDVNSLSDSELMELGSMVSQELVRRNIESSSDYYPGEYVIGSEIPEGDYLVCCTGTLMDSQKGYFGVRDYESRASHGYEYLDVGEVYYRHLEKGMSITFLDGTFVLMPYNVPSV